MLASDLAHTSIHAEDNPEEEFSENEAESEPEAHVERIHRRLGVDQSLLDRFGIILLHNIDASVDHLKVGEAGKIFVCIALVVSSAVTKPRAPHEQAQAARVVKEQHHDAELIINLLSFDQAKDEQTRHDPEGEADDKCKAHALVEIVVDLTTYSRSLHCTQSHGSCATVGFTSEGPVDCRPIPG